MSGSALVDLQYLYYQVQLCVPDTLQQGFDAIKTHLAVAVLVRLLAASRLLRPAIMNIVCTLLGVWLVWYNYGYIVWYCIALAGTSYAMLATGVPFKGPLLGTFAIMYIVSCELFAVEPTKWHEIRGSMLMMIMKVVAVAFDLDAVNTSLRSESREGKGSSMRRDKWDAGKESSAGGSEVMLGDGEVVGVNKSDREQVESKMLRKRTTQSSSGVADSDKSANVTRSSRSKKQMKSDDVKKKKESFRARWYYHFWVVDMETPPLLDFVCYALSPLTGTFGPFLTLKEHQQLLTPAPLDFSWMVYVVRSFVLSFLCLCVSVCVAPDLFMKPTWNKWFVAYCSAASFRFSHYFISFLSEGLSALGGLGYNHSKGQWGTLQVVKPLDVELPRSLGMVVTSWNLSMHRFLKYYVFKPSLKYIGRFGAILLTYIASSLLHGMNLQLAAVLLSIGVYAYIENVLRSKLSRRLSMCVQDRPCKEDCGHTRKKGHPMALFINCLFMCLAVFHLAYLGQMFLSDPDSEEFDYQGFSIWHTLRNWSELGFVSHFVAAGTLVLAVVL